MNDCDTCNSVGWHGVIHNRNLPAGLEANAACVQRAGTAVIDSPTGLDKGMRLVR